MAPARSLSVVIPVLNEEAAVLGAVETVRQRLEQRGGEWEIVVVDNASVDATVARLSPLASDARVRVLRNAHNFGKGYSVRRGMLAATGDLRLMCDVDCSESFVSLPVMEALLTQADVVAGSRNSDGATVERYQPLRRRAVSIVFIYLCRLLMSEPLSDVFCGFKLFTAAAAEASFAHATIDGWAFDAEVLGLARAAGYRVLPCGIAWSNRPQSRLSIPRTLLPSLRDLIRARAHVRAVRAAASARPSSGAPRPATRSRPRRSSGRRSRRSHS